MRKAILVSAVLVCGWSVIRVIPTASALGQQEAETFCVVTHVDAIPPFAAEARGLLRQFLAETRKDPGAIRIEVFEEIARPNHSTVVEIWENRKAYEDHLAADHTKAYRTKLQPMLGSPFDERLHRPVK